MKHSSRYFKNEACEYYPCHAVEPDADFNCLFCYCPLNRYADCPGTPQYIKKADGSQIKDCSACTFPHQPDNYDRVIAFLVEKMK